MIDLYTYWKKTGRYRLAMIWQEEAEWDGVSKTSVILRSLPVS